MMRRRAHTRILFTSLMMLLICSVLLPVTALAADPKVTLETRFPVITGESGSPFGFDVTLELTGPERQRFNVTVIPANGWTAAATVSFKQAAVVEIGPSDQFPASETISVSMSPVSGKNPDPGDYVTKLELVSSTLRKSIDLTARVTARYGMNLVTDSGKLSTDAAAGKDTHLALSLSNTGTAAIDNINFYASKPEGWKVTFSPDKVDSLPAGYTQQLDVVINPPAGKSIAGDYAMSINAQGSKASDSVEMRVTVKTPSIWGFVSIGLVLVVVAGLVVLFRVLGRR